MSGQSEIVNIGVDLGGTKVEIALVNSKGDILASHRLETHSDLGANAIIADIINSLGTYFGESYRMARGLGIGVAGQIERATGRVLYAPNLGWHNVDLKARFETALDMPVVVTNDVRAATWGEWKYGAGQGVEDVVCLFIGTGIGGGIVSGGKILEGNSNTAGELGHITIVTDGRDCHCSNKGCLEAYAGGWAIAVRAQEAVRANPKDGQQLLALAGAIEEISAGTVAQAYADGNHLARALIEETATYLAAGVVSIINAFNPCLLVFGGGVIQGLPALVYLINDVVRSNALQAAVEGLRIEVETLGDKVGVIGAAALAHHEYGEPI